jgi:hypothetical protein
MASDVVYADSINLYVLARELQEAYYDHIGHVDLESIYFAEKHTENEKPKKAKVCEISSISSAWIRQLFQKHNLHKSYCLSVWAEDWGRLTSTEQQWFMFDLLYSVAPDGNGKLRKPDVQEHGPLCEFLGPYWRKNTITLPSMLGTDPLPIPPPPLNQDDGSSIQG